MDERKLASRMVFIAAIICLCIAVCIVKLVDLQVVNGEENLENSDKFSFITTYETVYAARGQVFDRNGVPVITNRTVYSLGFEDIAFFSDEEINENIVTLLRLCENEGLEHTDTLPMNSRGVAFTKANTLNQERFDGFAARFGWDPSLSATEIFSNMLTLYDLNDTGYDQGFLREIVGVRYELSLRNILNIPDYVFAVDVDTSLIARIREQGLRLVTVSASSERVYNTKYAAHLLGQTGKMDAKDYEKYGPLGYDMDEIIGKSGIEAAFEEYLHGKRGLLETRTNSQGAIISQKYVTEPEAGADIYLTIDLNMQAVAEQALADCIEKLHETGSVGLGQEAKGGAVVAMDVNTFEVLASASYPTFDITTYGEDVGELVKDSLSPLLNRATQGMYEPGSTFKMVTALSALESGKIDTDTYIVDNGIYTYYAPSYTPACWIYTSLGVTHGAQNVSEALKNSCNCFFYEAGRLTGIDVLNKYSKLFGLGESTGIEINEETGILAGPAYREKNGRSWAPGDTIQAAIGQSDNNFTPLQMTCYISALANGGNRYNAHLLKTAVSPTTGEIIDAGEKELLSTVSFSRKNYDAILEGMREASATGTASGIFRNYPIEVASKTGSAQTGMASDNGVFVCFAPYNDPQIAVMVIVEQGGQGSLVGSVAKEVLDQYFFSSSFTGIQKEGSLVE